MCFLRGFGRGLRSGFVAVGALAFLGTVIALATNYTVTQGSGTTFGSIVVSAVNYAQQLVCDPSTPSQCAAVDSSGILSVKSATLATAANQSTANSSLATIATNTGAAIPAQTAPYTIIGGVINGADTYNTVAASQSAQALTGGSGGATGDYLSHCTVVPTSTSPGVVTILDNSTTIYGFPGGASSLSNLVPFTIPIGAVSTSGAWKVTTGASLSVVCVGKFH